MNRPDIRNQIDNIIQELAWCVEPCEKDKLETRICAIMQSVALLAGEIEQELRMANVRFKWQAAQHAKQAAQAGKDGGE